MLGGDISNKQAPIIAFNIDNLLFIKDDAKDSFIKSVVARVMSSTKKFTDQKVDKLFVSIVNRLWGKYDYSIYFVTMHPELVQDYYDILDRNDVNYTSIVSFNNLDDLRDISLLQYTYYFDSNEELISFVGAKAQHINEIQNILK